MDYVSTNSDYLINFKKIKYRNAAAQASFEQAERQAKAIEAQRVRQAQIEQRNSARRNVEVTRDLSGMKNARTGVRMTAQTRTQRVAYGTPAVKNTSAKAASKAAEKKRIAERARGAMTAKSAAEFLKYSCEEKTYCDTWSTGAKMRFPISFLACVAGITILFVMLIGSYSQLTEATATQSMLEKEISRGISYRAELEEQIEEKIDLAEIERIAINRLGMVKSDASDRGYISIAGQDKIVVSDVDEGTDENVSVVMSGVGRLFRNLVVSEK